MMKQNKSGFTLVELLAVVVILAIILAIAVPGISNIINSSRKSALQSDAKLVLKAIDLKKLETEDFNPVDYNTDLEGLLTALKLNGDNYESVVFTVNNGKLLLTIEGKGKWDGLTACGSYHNMKVSDEGCELDLTPPVIALLGGSTININGGDSYVDPGVNVTDNSGESIEASVDTSALNINEAGEYVVTYTATDSSGNTVTVTRTIIVIIEYSDSEGVNKPQLAQGMTAIKWVDNDWVKVDNPNTDTSWYDYANKEWANAVTSDCTTPGDYDTCSMWVWIPRYAYQIATLYHTASATSAGTVNIKFLKNTSNKDKDNVEVATTPTYSGASQTNFIKHPAFTFGTTELTGIWVAKFETSGTTASLDYKPGVSSLRSTTVGNMFTASRNMETNNKYGWALASGLNADGTFTTNTNDVDTHMMKNSEWGAVAYLSQSTFGKNAEITINSDSNYYTGGGSGTAYITNTGQSTTGNIYGIYDMSGGSYEYVMGNYNNTAGSSGLTPSSINDKYIDRYPATAYTASIYGDAVYETSSSSSGSTSWYSDYSNMPGASSPWFNRGGSYVSGSGAGAFDFHISGYGGADSNYSWRSVVLVGAGL